MKKVKQKTKKSAIKRFKVTGTGRILHRRSFTSHLNEKRSSRQKRRLAGHAQLTGAYEKKLRKVMGIRTN